MMGDYILLGFTYYPTEGMAVPGDCNGSIPTSSEFQTLVTRVERFYAATSNEDIQEHNREVQKAMMEAAPGKKGQRQKKKGFVYILKADNGLFKIGRATIIDNRIKQLAVSLPYELQLIHSIVTDDMDALEGSLHRKFLKKHLRGEWFELDEVDIEYIKGLGSHDDNPN